MATKMVKKKTHPKKRKARLAGTSSRSKKTPGRSKLPTPKGETLTGTPGQKIQSIGRGFRLSFSDLGYQRKIDDTTTATMVDGMTVDRDQLKLSKVLYGRHPAITKKNQAKNRVKELFEAKTLPFPEGGVRLFPVRNVDVEEQNEEIRVFVQEMRDAIQDYEAAVHELTRQWPSIIELARDKLGDLFDPSDYPPATTIASLLTITFEPHNVELPNYYKAVSPEEYNRAVALLEAKFEKAALMQEEHITTAFADALDQMVESIDGYHHGRQRSFRNSVIERVFAAFTEFKTKTQEYGILRGTALEQQFEAVMQVMTEGQHTSQTLATALRDNEDKRIDVIAKVGEVRNQILELSTDKPRRDLIRE